MAGETESLNAAISGSLLMFEVYRQRFGVAMKKSVPLLSSVNPASL